MLGGWLLDRMRGRALSSGLREVERFVRALEAMEDEELGVLVAVIAAVRANFETQGVLPEGLFADTALPSVEALGVHQMKINRVARQFARMGRKTDSAAAMVLSYSLRCLNVPELRPLGRRMWAALGRGFAFAEEALRDGEEERGAPFPARVWKEWRDIPVGLEPEPVGPARAGSGV